MTDVYERVQSVVQTSLQALKDPVDVPADCLFGRDASLVGFRTYDIFRTRWSTGVANLQVGSDLSKRRTPTLTGAHLTVLRSAMLATAKASWIVSSFEHEERVARAAAVVITDRLQGQKAMQAISQAAPDPGFSDVATRFEQAGRWIREELVRSKIRPVKLPSETELVVRLGTAVDEYYGTAGESKREALILWGASSSLSHRNFSS